jgi:hypothetical protein
MEGKGFPHAIMFTGREGKAHPQVFAFSAYAL